MNNIIPVRDFFRNSNVRNFLISPNGRHLAFLKNVNNRMTLHIRNNDGSDERMLTSPGERDIAAILWGNDDIVLFMQDFGGDENYHIYSVSIESGKIQDLTPFPGSRTIPGRRSHVDFHKFIVSSNKRLPDAMDLYSLDCISGEMNLLYENNNGFIDFKTDYLDMVRLAFSTDGVRTSVYHRNSADDEFKPLFTPDGANEKFTVYGFAEDNRRIYVGANNGRDKAGIYLFDTETAQFTEEIYYDAEFDASLDVFGGILFSRSRRMPAVIQYQRDYPANVALDSYFGKIYQEVERQIDEPRINISHTSYNTDETLFTFVASSDSHTEDEYLYDATTKQLKLLVLQSQHLHRERMAKMLPVNYQSRDGRKISAYLTLPNGVEPKNLPAIIHPHGGPNHVRDVWDWDPLVQFLANRGYVVLQPNYRGSDGYGKEFFEICFKQWGRAMQDDLTDGALWLAEQGIADKNRIGIMGGSYGGYATLAGVTFTPDIYCCGVSIVGPSNLFTFLNSIPPYWEPFRLAMDERIGHIEKDKELLHNASPLFFADNIRVPLLIAQGANDPRVKQAESEQIVAKLRENGKDVEYILKENEGHGFRNEENRFELYEAIERFLAKHLGGYSVT